MHHRVYGLTSHADLTRFEVEDGLLRHTAPELLKAETSITAVTLDVAIADHAGQISDYDNQITISASDEADAAPTNLVELVSEVAIVKASAWFTITEVAELSTTWVGSATPGPKVTLHFDPASENSGSYRGDVEELAGTVAKSLGDVGSRVLHAGAAGRWPRSTAISFWFPNRDAAKDAFDGDGFAGLTTSSLINNETLVIVQAVEHRVLPNPNTWTTTTGVEPPTAV